MKPEQLLAQIRLSPNGQSITLPLTFDAPFTINHADALRVLILEKKPVQINITGLEILHQFSSIQLTPPPYRKYLNDIFNFNDMFQWLFELPVAKIEFKFDDMPVLKKFHDFVFQTIYQRALADDKNPPAIACQVTTADPMLARRYQLEFMTYSLGLGRKYEGNSSRLMMDYYFHLADKYLDLDLYQAALANLQVAKEEALNNKEMIGEKTKLRFAEKCYQVGLQILKNSAAKPADLFFALQTFMCIPAGTVVYLDAALLRVNCLKQIIALAKTEASNGNITNAFEIYLELSKVNPLYDYKRTLFLLKHHGNNELLTKLNKSQKELLLDVLNELKEFSKKDPDNGQLTVAIEECKGLLKAAGLLGDFVKSDIKFQSGLMILDPKPSSTSSTPVAIKKHGYR